MEIFIALLFFLIFLCQFSRVAQLFNSLDWNPLYVPISITISEEIYRPVLWSTSWNIYKLILPHLHTIHLESSSQFFLALASPNPYPCSLCFRFLLFSHLKNISAFFPLRKRNEPVYASYNPRIAQVAKYNW